MIALENLAGKPLSALVQMSSIGHSSNGTYGAVTSPPRYLTWNLLRFFVAAILASSAALKLHQLLTSTELPEYWVMLPQVQWLTAGLESALAALLLSGRFARAGRLIAIATFCTFAAVSLQAAIGGRRSCCCFGKVEAQPWLVFFLDLFIIVSLVWTKSTSSAPTFRLPTKFAVSITAILLMSGVAAAILLTPALPPLQVLDLPIKEIVTSQGSSVSCPFKIRNVSNSPISIRGFSSSCECVSIGLSSWTILPGENCDGLATMDFSIKPDFTGDLAITSTALSNQSHAQLASVTFYVIVTPILSRITQ